jgi:hypothetical protein
MAKKTNLEKVADALGYPTGRFTDSSASWVEIQDQDHSICIGFTGDGKTFTDITIAKRVWAVVDEPVLFRVDVNK